MVYCVEKTNMIIMTGKPKPLTILKKYRNNFKILCLNFCTLTWVSCYLSHFRDRKQFVFYLKLFAVAICGNYIPHHYFIFPSDFSSKISSFLYYIEVFQYISLTGLSNWNIRKCMDGIYSIQTSCLR